MEWRDVSSATWKRASVSTKVRVIDEDLWPDDESAGSGLDVKTYDCAAENQSWWVELESGGAEWWVCVAGIGFRTELRQCR